ncbi:MAG: holo-ACP synthase [Candidatus Marinimicrobia bacterium]|nr:holo-ACP synthase [Candidatus Neomarinimicrobiota bacterium]
MKIGIDIIKIDRIDRLIQNYGNKFLDKYFDKEEIRYCKSKVVPLQHFAGKFAAKEAVKKALLSTNPTLIVPLSDIVIRNNSLGKPYVRLRGNVGEICKNYIIEVSISHEKNDYAIAIALVAI